MLCKKYWFITALIFSQVNSLAQCDPLRARILQSDQSHRGSNQNSLLDATNLITIYNSLDSCQFPEDMSGANAFLLPWVHSSNSKLKARTFFVVHKALNLGLIDEKWYYQYYIRSLYYDTFGRELFSIEPSESNISKALSLLSVNREFQFIENDEQDSIQIDRESILKDSIVLHGAEMGRWVKTRWKGQNGLQSLKVQLYKYKGEYYYIENSKYYHPQKVTINRSQDSTLIILYVLQGAGQSLKITAENHLQWIDPQGVILETSLSEYFDPDLR